MAKKNNKNPNKNVSFNNDQLGENASEQYKSESYSNTKPSKKYKK